jgi:hypothetical protein
VIGDGRPAHLIEQALTLGRREHLRIGHAGHVAVGVQHDCGGDDRAGQAAPADLVDSGNVHDPTPPDRILDRARCPWASHVDPVAATVF